MKHTAPGLESRSPAHSARGRMSAIPAAGAAARAAAPTAAHSPTALRHTTLGPAPDASSPLRVVHCRSILDIDEAHWDSINGESDAFHGHRFIRCVEEARVENSDFWYLLFYRGDVLVATTVLSAFEVALDLFVSGATARLIRAIRRVWPRFMKIRVLFCGLPVSLGQSNLVMRDAADAAEVVPLLVREMTALCRSSGIRYMCVKEFPTSRLPLVHDIERHGFFLANTLPYVSMNIAWTSFDAYLASLRHGYRRPIRLSLKRLGLETPRIAAASHENGHRYPPGAPDNAVAGAPFLLLGGPEVCSRDRLYELYLNVMGRARVKLETLNRSFFDALYANIGADLELLALVKDGETLGCAVLMSTGRTMTFMLVGLDYERRDEYDVYFNLMYGIISLAIERGCRELHLGQTSYWLKQRIGGRCTPEYMYFKSTRHAVHVCLRALRSRVFPATRVAEPRVFRCDARLASDAGYRSSRQP